MVSIDSQNDYCNCIVQWQSLSHTGLLDYEYKPISNSQMGLVIYTDPSPCYEDTLNAMVTRQVLDNALGYVTTSLWSHEQLKELITMATLIEVVLDSGAEIMLESFYTGSRRVRGSDMPNTALDTM